MLAVLFVFLLSATNIFCEQTTSSTQQWLPKILWTFWQNPLTDKDNILKSFHHNHVKMLPGWQVNLLDKNTAVEWLRKVPDYKDELQLDYFKNDVPAKRANLVRFAMLKHFGGVWVDFTTIITSNFEWLYKLNQLQQTVNAKGDAPEVFMVYRLYENPETYFSVEDNKNYMLSPAFEIYFMAAAPKSKLLQETYQMYLDGKAESKRLFGQNKMNRSVVVETGKAERIRLGNYASQYFETEAGIQIILQRKQREFDKLHTSGERKLAVHYYKVWGMAAEKSTFLMNTQQGRNNKYYRVVHMMHQMDIDYLKQKKLFPKYFIKFFSDLFHGTQKFIIDKNESRNISQLSCPEIFSILQNSIIYQFMLKDFPVFYQNQVVKISFNRQCFYPSSSINRKLGDYQIGNIQIANTGIQLQALLISSIVLILLGLFTTIKVCQRSLQSKMYLKSKF